ncbi:hypothetical protein DFA_10251 [Cavenderia fasciculata]|uniref:Uncharacterized protein n=1 Tax=Cavenderia fasciculata TaxID=261658 RepID=F4Q9P7_CACFS|nr:uncharacterized protein DFA_10251 [Cavenderia fasciculata]EGG15416.1 hypothetical protein DFA_10251 [Cavenderia fasciculata]|eukprot:XP_004354158.1 hypothetical protein DFA_10251 [Cavenderia fasciculata]
MSENNSNNNNDNHDQIDYISIKLPTLILLDIISKINNNVDMICFLMTCKRLYHTIRCYKNTIIRFKGLKVVLVTRLSKCLLPFRHIVQHSLSNHLLLINQDYGSKPRPKGPTKFHVIKANDFNNSIRNSDINSTYSYKDRDNNQYDSEEMNMVENVQISLAYTTNRGVKIDPYLKLPSSTRSLIIERLDDLDAPPLNHLPPSVKHVSLSCQEFNCEQDFIIPDTVESLAMYTSNVRCTTIKLPSSLKSLVWGNSNGPFLPLDQFQFNKLTSLTSLKMCVSQFGTSRSILLPPNLTSLNLTFKRDFDIPSPNLFQPLASSLTNLELYGLFGAPYIPINLQPLTRLKSVRILGKMTVSLPVTPTLTHLDVYGSTIDLMPESLESLEIGSYQLIIWYLENPVPLPSTLKHLSIVDSLKNIPPRIMPPGLPSLQLVIDKDKQTNLDGLFPPSLHTLCVSGRFSTDILSKIPNTIKSLEWERKKGNDDGVGTGIPLTLPNHLMELKWLPQNLSDVISFAQLDHLTSLTIELPIFQLKNGKSLYSLININNNNIVKSIFNNNDMLLPNNIINLTLVINGSNNLCIRLDDIINGSYVEELTIQVNDSKWITFSIRRFDDNTVFIVDNQSMFGGFMTLGLPFNECGVSRVCTRANDTTSICAEPFSQQVAGSNCTYSGSYISACDISQGLYCSKDNICAPIPDAPSNSVCTDDNDCNALETCLCTGSTNQASLAYANCLIENNCAAEYLNVVNTMSSKSCFAKCSSEMCAKGVCSGPDQSYPSQCEETAGSEISITCSNSSSIIESSSLFFIFFAILSVVL